MWKGKVVEKVASVWCWVRCQCIGLWDAEGDHLYRMTKVLRRASDVVTNGKQAFAENLVVSS